MSSSSGRAGPSRGRVRWGTWASISGTAGSCTHPAAERRSPSSPGWYRDTFAWARRPAGRSRNRVARDPVGRRGQSPVGGMLPRPFRAKLRRRVIVSRLPWSAPAAAAGIAVTGIAIWASFSANRAPLLAAAILGPIVSVLLCRRYYRGARGDRQACDHRSPDRPRQRSRLRGAARAGSPSAQPLPATR